MYYRHVCCMVYRKFLYLNSRVVVCMSFAYYSYNPLPWLGWFYRRPDGGIDTKVTSYEWMNAKHLQVSAQSGPTHDDNPPFDWGDSQSEWAYNLHIGQPQVFNFPFVDFKLRDEETVIDIPRESLPVSPSVIVAME